MSTSEGASSWSARKITKLKLGRNHEEGQDEEVGNVGSMSFIQTDRCRFRQLNG